MSLAERKIIIVSIVLSILLVGLFFLARTPKKAVRPPAATPQAKLSADIIPRGLKPKNLPTAPQVTITSYELKASLPKSPETAKVYAFLQPLSQSFINNLIAKTTGDGMRQNHGEGITSVVQLTNIERMGTLSVNEQTAAFVFESYGLVRPTAMPSGTAQVLAQAYLSELGLYDQTMKQIATYRRKTFPGVTFVEYHRAWDAVGLPILSIAGVINVPEETSLSSLSFLSTDPTIVDPTVYETSDKTDGLLRKADFNTVTVGVRDDGTIYTISSTIRPFSQTAPIAYPIKTAQGAFDEVKRGKGIYRLTLPVGEGIPNMERMYPNNKADLTKATITDVLLTYLETPNRSQSYLQPFYIFRGIGKLASGYDVQFVEAIPAVRDVVLPNDVLGAQTELAQNNSLKLGTFNPQILATPTPGAPVVSVEPSIPLRKPPTGIPPATPSSQCEQDIATYPWDKANDPYPAFQPAKAFEVAGLGNFYVLGGRFHHAFYFAPRDGVQIVASELKTLLYDQIAEQVAISYGRVFAVHPEIIPASPTVAGVMLAATSLLDRLNITSIINKQPISPEDQKLLGYVYPPYNQVNPKGLDGVDINSVMFGKLVGQISTNHIADYAQRKDLFSQSTILHLDWAFFPGGWSPNTPACMTYVSGDSPNIYLYSDTPMQFSVSVGGEKRTYADPPTQDGVWTGKITSDGMISVGKRVVRKLYYEYMSHNFNRPKEGFMVASDHDGIAAFITRTLGPKLALRDAEISDLVLEVRNGIGQEQAPYWRISIANQTEVDTALPIIVRPAPVHKSRLLLLLDPIDHVVEIPKPSITPIPRGGFSLVEIGATR